MKVRLTQKQVEELAPYFDRVRATASMGTPGMLVAQLRYDPHRDEYTLEPAFLDHDLATIITERGQREIPGPIRLERRKDSSKHPLETTTSDHETRNDCSAHDLR